MQEISSLLSLSNAAAASCFAAFCGSLCFMAMSTASWLFTTFHKPSLARMRTSVSAVISALVMSGSELKCDLRFLSPKARETANWPFTLATSPDMKKQCTLFLNFKIRKVVYIQINHT